MKAVAVQAVFLIAVIMIFLFFVAALFFQWIEWTDESTNSFSCNAKMISFCSDWRKEGKDPGWWESKGPNCDEFVTKPSSIDDCPV